PLAFSAAWLLALEKPRLAELRMRRTSGNSAATISGAPSVEALSTTITSRETPCGWSWRDSRQSRNKSPQFQLAMQTETSMVRGSANWRRRAAILAAAERRRGGKFIWLGSDGKSVAVSEATSEHDGTPLFDMSSPTFPDRDKAQRGRDHK